VFVDIITNSWNQIESWVFQACEAIKGNSMFKNSLIYA